MDDMIVRHWSLLEGSVHPLDSELLERESHSFNLDFPPPAFIGDIINARVVLLEANGGYDPVVTPQEFSDPMAVSRYLNYLRHPQPLRPELIAPYYGRRNYAELIASGDMTLVNAVAYRSAAISREPENKRIAGKLPSALLHKKWLRNVLLPAAARGERLVVAHRNALWGLGRSEAPLPGVLFTTNPVSSDLSRAALEEIRLFLVGQR